MDTYFQRVQFSTPTRFWINNVTRNEAQLAIAAGAVGCTQNPSYVWKMLQHPEEAAYTKELLADIMIQESDDSAALERLQAALVGNVAKSFLPLFKQSNGAQGYVSIQGNPFHEDTASIIRYAHMNRMAGENIMVKIPVTQMGLEAIRVLAAEGVPINATECMAVKQVLDVCDTYVAAIKDLPSPAPLCFSLITGIFDEYLQKTSVKQKIDVNRDALWQAGICVAKKVHQLVKERQYPCYFVGGGARGLHHFTEMVGADAAITINWAGTADELLRQNMPVIPRFYQPVSFSVVDELIEKLSDFRKAYFINAIVPDEYEDFGPVVLFRTSFEAAWKNALEYISNYRQNNAKEA